MQVKPYLFLNGQVEEALEFYRANLGAEIVTLARFKESPPNAHTNIDAGFDDKVMYAELRIGDSTVQFSDSATAKALTGFSLSLNPSDASETERIFAALADGGVVTVPLAKTFFAPLFGWVTDRFGVSWMIAMEQPA